MERFDILDCNGRSTGRTMNKGEVLIDGEYYLGIHAYLMNSRGEFLLQRRALDKDFLPGSWEIHMGHAMAGETSGQSALRELYEELGLTFDIDDLRFVGRILWAEGHHMIDMYFVRCDAELSSLQLQPEEVIDVKWVSGDDMFRLIDSMDYRPLDYRILAKSAVNRALRGIAK